MSAPTQALNRLLANDGMVYLTGTDANTTDFYGIVIREDTVITAWTDEDGKNLLTDFNISTVTLLATDPALIIPGGKTNGSLQLASGSVWLLKE
jgi:hypothetical protein